MTFRNLTRARFIGLDPVANILYPALLAVWVAGAIAMAVGLFFVAPVPW